MDQFKANPYRFYSEHPETTPHIHSVILVAPTLVDRFKKIAPELELLFQKMGPANRTLHCAPLQTPDELRDVIFYSSKLLKEPPGVLRQLSKRYRMPPKQPDSPQRSVCDIDLYTVLPKAKSEPIYVKANWERELEAAQKEARSWVGRDRACINR